MTFFLDWIMAIGEWFTREHRAKIHKLEMQAVEYRRALQFYSPVWHYPEFTVSGQIGSDFDSVLIDRGGRARIVLYGKQ